jgi:hypothetical protein
MSMEYTLYYAGGDTTVRIFQDENMESFQFQIPYTVTDIGIDTRNHVLDGQHAETKDAKNGVGSPMFNIAPNPSPGTFHFRFDQDQAGERGESVEVEIVDLAGRMLYRKQYRDVQPFLDYPVEMAAPVRGICLVRFSYGNRIEVHKILVE